MKLLVEVTVPEYVAILPLDFDLVDRDECTAEILIPKSQQEVDIDLKDLDLDELINFVQSETLSTLVDWEDLKEIERLREAYEDLENCFEKHTLNQIQRQNIIQGIIDQLDKSRKI